MPIVFATQECGRHNIAQAMEFGDIQIVTESDYPLFRDGRPTVAKITDRLSTFDNETDFLLLIGDPVVIGICFAVLTYRGFKGIRVLKWDRQASRYIPTFIPLR